MKNYLTVFFFEVSVLEGTEANKFRKSLLSFLLYLEKKHKVSKILICKKGA